MKFIGQAESVGNRIVELFRAGNLPEALAPMFIRRGELCPCRAWSWSNQLLTALAGFDDARGFRQWESVGRYVRKGEKAFHILGPVVVKRREIDDAGEPSERSVVVGFKSIPVFGYEQTDGEALPDRTVSSAFIDALPLVSVAREWGLSVQTYSGRDGAALGWYRHGQAIALGVENLSTWAHELVHAADDRRGELRGSDKLSREVVAELGGAILLTSIGRAADADYGGCWRYIEAYAGENKQHVLSVCERLLRRTCEAVALILDAAQTIGARPAEAPRASAA